MPGEVSFQLWRLFPSCKTLLSNILFAFLFFIYLGHIFFVAGNSSTIPWAGLGSRGRIDILQGRNGVFSSRKSCCCCCWEGAVVFDGSNKSCRISSNNESLLPSLCLPWTQTSWHSNHKNHVLGSSCCSSACCVLPHLIPCLPGFCWMDFQPSLPTSIHPLPISLSLSFPWKSRLSYIFRIW